MNIETEITRYVAKSYAAVMPDTLEKAAGEAEDYKFARISAGYFTCTHGDHTYVIHETDNTFGCSCRAMQYGSGNKICKHLATFQVRTKAPQNPISEEAARALMAAGWTGGKGELIPPTDASDPDGDDQEGSDPVPERAPKPSPEPEPSTPKVKDAETQPEYPPAVKQVIAEAEGFGASDIDPEYVSEKLQLLTGRYKVSVLEAVRSVVSGILRTQKIKRPKREGGADSNVLLTVDMITAPDVWCNIKVKVVELWDATSDAIRQDGRLGDETGTVRFKSWEKSDLELLEEGKCYSLENVVTSEYEGSFSVAMTKNAKITEIEDEIEVVFTTAEFAGIMVNIQDGSGLIKRCETCNRAMQHGECKKHGRGAGIHDLRIKGVLDNGTAYQNVLFNQEQTEAISGISLDDAVAMATDALDASVVGDKIKDMLIGHEFAIMGRDMGDTILVENCEEITAPPQKEDIEMFIKEV